MRRAPEPTFTLGIEEEYLLVDRATRALAIDLPETLFSDCEARIQALVRPEFLRSQLEIGTGVCASLGEARADLARLRRTVAEVAAGYGLAPIAASTHPFSEWQTQKHSETCTLA